MPRKRMRAKERQGVTPTEWSWLTGAADADPLVGYTGGAQLERLLGLWQTHETEVRRTWRTQPPVKLPQGHPAREDA